MRMSFFGLYLAVAALVIPVRFMPTSSTFQPPKVLGVKKHTNIKVVYDVRDDVWDAGIGQGLYYARGLLESYKGLKIKPRT